MTRYSFGGDEYVFTEVEDEMSLREHFKTMTITETLERRIFREL